MIRLKTALASTAVVAAMLGAHAAQAATATATARARIVPAVAVTNIAGSELGFATIVTGPTAAKVTVAPNGTRTACGTGLTCVGTTSAARFAVTGETGLTVGISTTATTALTSGGNSMSTTLVPSVATMTLAATNQFSVGGELSVGANQADGVYTGTFTVTVDYN